MKVAITHDYLVEYGGAERLVETLLKIFPTAVVVTLSYDRSAFPKYWDNYQIKCLMPVLPFSRRYPQFWGILYVIKMLRCDLSRYDLIVSSDQIFAKMISLMPGQKHICYQHSPSNVLYGYLPDMRKRSVLRKFLALTTYLQKDFLRLMESYCIENIDKLITNSEHSAKRIARYWGKEAEVVFSAVEIAKGNLSDEKEDYFLVVARIVKGKRIEVAVEACRRMDLRLKVVGTGSALAELKRIGGKRIEFLGSVSDKVRDELYKKARAVIVVQEEDLGLTPIEAMSWGTPVIAYGKGGARETVVENVTGLFFSEQSVESVTEAIERFLKMEFDKAACRKQAERFSFERFESRIRGIVDEVMTEVYG